MEGFRDPDIQESRRGSSQKMFKAVKDNVILMYIGFLQPNPRMINTSMNTMPLFFNQPQIVWLFSGFDLTLASMALKDHQSHVSLWPHLDRGVTLKRGTRPLQMHSFKGRNTHWHTETTRTWCVFGRKAAWKFREWCLEHISVCMTGHSNLMCLHMAVSQSPGRMNRAIGVSCPRDVNLKLKPPYRIHLFNSFPGPTLYQFPLIVI